MRIAILHPGAMGAVVGELLIRRGHEVLWTPRNRSEETRKRADDAGLTPVKDLDELAAHADLIISIVPPHAAEDVAAAAVNAGFQGLFLDANAIAPELARNIARRLTDANATYIDGSLVGPPPRKHGDARLYLSGDHARTVADAIRGDCLDVRILDAHEFAASAIKMAFAGWTKGTAALLANIRALAEQEGVLDDLLAEWRQSMPHVAERCEQVLPSVGPKAWRFIGEMEQIAHAFNARDLPSGFHDAAAEVYRRIDADRGKD